MFAELCLTTVQVWSHGQILQKLCVQDQDQGQRLDHLDVTEVQ